MEAGGAAERHRARELYWRLLTQLKTDALYMRLYRDDRARWVTRLATLRAIASSGSIALWAIWREYALLWAAIIAASQVADALKDVFPFSREHKAASEYMLVLERLLIDAEREWQNVFTRRNLDDQAILNQHHRLRMLMHEAELKAFPDGLPRRISALNTIAEQASRTYFSEMYPVEDE